MFEPDNEQIQAVIIANDTLEVVSLLNDAVNDTETLGIEIAPLGIYCQKTGYLIGNRNENSVFSLIKMHGKGYAVWSLYNVTSLNVHPAWTETANDKDILDTLMEHDPIGYACYCFGLITAQFYQTPKNQDPKRFAFAERYWAMARANTLMHMKGTANLSELNHALCRLVSFMPDASNLLLRQIRKFGQAPDTLALLHASGDLIAKLNDATNKTLDSIGYSNAYIKRTRFVDISATPEDAARGPSQVRRQKASKRSVKEASMFGELSKLFADAGLDYVPGFDGLPGTTKWRERFEATKSVNEEKDNILMADFAELANLSNLADFDTEEDDDNSVEYRTLPTTFGSEGENNPSVSTIPNENNNDNSPDNTELLEIAADMMNAPIQPIMVEIAKAVMENVVENPLAKALDIISKPDFGKKEKPMTALERIRAMKGSK